MLNDLLLQVIVNELGLDPGLDIISAMQMLETAHKAGRTVTSFVSLCGGLPAPEDSGVPLGSVKDHEAIFTFA